MLRQFVSKSTTIHGQGQGSPPKKIYSRLVLSELRYRRLFETAQDGILILKADSGKIIDANPFLKDILGYSQDELIGKELWQIGVFKDIVASKEAFLELQRSGYIRYKDLPLQTKDGKKIDVEFVSNSYMVGDEKVIQCNIRDISSRKLAEMAAQSKAEQLDLVRKSQEKAELALLNVMEDLESAKSVIEHEKAKDDAIIASIGDGLIAVDNQKTILMINKAAEKILGWKKEEVVGHTINSLPLVDEEGHPISVNKRPTSMALSSGKLMSKNYYFVKKNKTRFPISINVTPVKLGGKIIGAIDVFRDITRELEIDKAKSEFVSLASHQLRTPLGIIKWYLEALQNEKYYINSPAVVRNYFEEIYKNNERVLALMRDLLSVSRIEQNKVQNVPKQVNLSEVVSTVVQQMQIIAKKKNIFLHLTIIDAKIPPVKIDVLRFHEVIENLVNNAIDYTPKNGSVEVTLSKNSDKLIMSVKDSGIGISRSDQKKLYNKFFRTEKGAEYNPEGTGLGLYVVKAYVEGWGGKISVNSIEGKGSTFEVTLPISQNKDIQTEMA